MLYRPQVEGQPLDRFSLADATSAAAAGAASREAQAPNAWSPVPPFPSPPAPSTPAPSAAEDAEDAEEPAWQLQQQELDAAAVEVADHARRTEAHAMVAQAQASLSAAKVPLRPPVAVRARALQLRRCPPRLLEPSGRLAEPPLRKQIVYPLCALIRST